MQQALFQKKCFIPFIMSGHPSLETSREAVLVLAHEGADLIELGVPFSDPVADGPVNQRAADIALEKGIDLKQILTLVRSLREAGCNTPMVLFSYLNPILAYGASFAQDAKAHGVDFVLIVDLPPEEGEAFYAVCQAAGLRIVLLVSPTTHPSRFDVYRRIKPAFIYYISRCAVTGAHNTLAPTLAVEVENVRKAFPVTPIVVGFGISTALQAKTVAALADGVVVGSALVQCLETDGIKAFSLFARQLADAIHGAV